jgi:regulator of ribonuclease activity A
MPLESIRGDIMDFFTADICDENSDKVQVLNPQYKSYGGANKCQGEIITIKLFEDNGALVSLLRDNQGDGKIVVVDVQGDYCAVVGDKLMGFAHKNNFAGIVVNGYVRDTLTTATIPVALYALGTYPFKSQKKADAELNSTLEFGSVQFTQGDYIYCDIDGIVLSKSKL